MRNEKVEHLARELASVMFILDELYCTATTLEEANSIIKELVSLVQAQQNEIESLKAGDIEDLQNRLGQELKSAFIGYTRTTQKR